MIGLYTKNIGHSLMNSSFTSLFNFCFLYVHSRVYIVLYFIHIKFCSNSCFSLIPFMQSGVGGGLLFLSPVQSTNRQCSHNIPWNISLVKLSFMRRLTLSESDHHIITLLSILITERDVYGVCLLF